jgi:hypothetical protein
MGCERRKLEALIVCMLPNIFGDDTRAVFNCVGCISTITTKLFVFIVFFFSLIKWRYGADQREGLEHEKGGFDI